MMSSMPCLIRTLLALLLDIFRFLVLCLRPPPAIVAENLFVRKQLAQYQERHGTVRTEVLNAMFEELGK